MLKKTTVLGVFVLSSLVLASGALAQESATLVLKSGDRISGELVDLGGVGFTMRVNGQDRNIATNDVALVEFAGGSPNGDAQAKINAGQPVVVLRNGDAIDGRLFDIGGTHPLRVTIDTPSGQRNFTSNDVAQIYMFRSPTEAVATTGRLAAPGAISVAANQPWTDTGISVSRGERVAFDGRGDILIAQNASSGVGGNPAVSVGKYPVPNAPVGALIGRVGNGTPFLIGPNKEPIAMNGSGRLMLGVNDDHYPDNTGSYSVTVTPLGR
jgi:hypothetical protein